MADRTVSIKLSVHTGGLTAGFKTATTAAQDFASKGLAAIGKNEQHINTLSNQMGLLGVAMVGAAGLAVKKFADFDAAMSNVAATGADAKGSIDALRDAAIDAGARTVYSASEAAGAIEELAKAGVSAADILGGGLDGALDLAAAGGIAVADAAGIAATAIEVFNLEGSDMTHVADLLAAGAGKAMGGVDDLGGALEQSALVAEQTGLSIEETTTALSLFAKAGMLGSDAGTSLKTMLQRLTPQSAEAREKFDELGISAYDAQGNFVGLSEFSGQLKEKMAGLTPEARNAAMAVMFGSDAVRAASVLYEEGSAGVDKWTKAVDDQGYAAETAATRLDNLKGDLEALGGSVDTFLISLGEGADGPLRGIVQGATNVVNEFGKIPGGAQSALLGITGVGGLAVLGLAGMGKLVIGINDAKTALAGLKVSAKTAAVAVGAIGGVFAVATIGITAWASAQADAAADVEVLKDTLDETTGAITELTRKAVALNLAKPGDWKSLDFSGSAVDGAKALGIELDVLTDAAMGNVEAMEQVYAAVGGADESMVNVRRSAKDAGLSIGDYNGATQAVRREIQGQSADLESAIALQKDVNAAVGESTTGQKELADGYDFTTGAVEGQTDALDDLIKAQATAAGVVMSERDAQRSLEAAIDDATEALKENGKTLDITTEKGRANQSALDDISSSGWDLIESMKANGASQAEIQATMATTRERFIEVAKKMGMGSDAAVTLADKLGLIPENVRSQVQIDTEAADAALTKFLNKNRRITVGTGFAGKDSKLRAATGGAISGAGTGTSDSIDALLSNGEHVLTASDVAKAGGQSAIYRMREAIQSGAMRFARGGGVSLNPIKDVRASVYADMSGAQSGLDSFKRQYPLAPAASSGSGDGSGSASKLVQFGRLIQGMGFSVSEHPAFGGVRGRHMVGSRHYSGRAIDVNAGAGTSLAEQRALASIIGLSKSYGLNNIFMKAGHYNHAHFDYMRGGYTGDGAKHKWAGNVHKGEFVMNSDVVNPKTLPMFDAINDKRVTLGSPHAYAQQSAPTPAGPAVAVEMSGTYYAFDPTDISRQLTNRLQDAVAANGITWGR